MYEEIAARRGEIGVPPAEPMDRRDRPRRHPWEIPLLVVAVFLTILIMGIAAGTLADALSSGKPLEDWALWTVSLPLIILFIRGLLRATQRMFGVKISETQFPEAHDMVVDAARHFGLKQVPDAYVVLGNGVINAFASGHGRRRYITIYSDLFEVGGEARNPEALRFVIGHEIGHIAAGHTSFWRQLGSFLIYNIPVVGPALSRAQEYTADNHGYAFCPEGTASCMGLLTVGKRLLGQVDFDALCDRATIERGFFAWLVNLQASHPVTIWRAAALRDRSRPGRLAFRPRRRPIHPGIGLPAVNPAVTG